MTIDPLSNPWHVKSVQEFMYINCPECVYKTKDEPLFQNHAIHNHPQSHVLFNIKDKSEFVDCDKVVKEENLEFIELYSTKR